MGLLILQESEMQYVYNEMSEKDDVVVAVNVELLVQVDFFDVDLSCLEDL